MQTMNLLYSGLERFDGSDPSKFDTWLHDIETLCLSTGQNPRFMMLANAGPVVRDAIRAMPDDSPWEAIRTEMKRCFSELKTKTHAAMALEGIHQKPEETLRLYTTRYGRVHYEATGTTAFRQRDQTRFTHFLKTLSNSSIGDKVIKSIQDDDTLGRIFQKCIEQETKLQLAEGLHLQRDPKVMQVNAQVDAVDVRARSNLCYQCGAEGHFAHSCPRANKMNKLARGKNQPESNNQSTGQNRLRLDPVAGQVEYKISATRPLEGTAVLDQFIRDQVDKRMKKQFPKQLKKFVKGQDAPTTPAPVYTAHVPPKTSKPKATATPSTGTAAQAKKFSRVTKPKETSQSKTKTSPKQTADKKKDAAKAKTTGAPTPVRPQVRSIDADFLSEDEALYADDDYEDGFTDDATEHSGADTDTTAGITDSEPDEDYDEDDHQE